MNSVQVNDLPELPFELIFSYLTLKDRLQARAVSRKWRNMINSFKLKSLCYSGRPSGFIHKKSSWVSGECSQNFISSLEFENFFQTFSQSIFINLKRLHLCKLDLDPEKEPDFLQMLNSFNQLQELGLFDITRSSWMGSNLQLNLPVLKSLHVQGPDLFPKLTLDAPRLQKVKFLSSMTCMTFVVLVHGESIEKLITDRFERIEVPNLKNLRYLYCGEDSEIDSTLLSTLEQLEEIHLETQEHVFDLFRQKERYSRANLKIYLCGFHLNSSSDPAIDLPDYSNRRYLVYLAENRSRLAAEVPFRKGLSFGAIETVAPELEIDLLNRFTDLKLITLKNEPVQEVERFLEFLKSWKNIEALEFDGDQPQALFDRLPDHCDIQELSIRNVSADLDFLLKLKSLMFLSLSVSIDIKFIQKVLKELPFLKKFSFKYLDKKFIITIDSLRQFLVRHSWDPFCGNAEVSDDVIAALKSIQENAQQK